MFYWFWDYFLFHVKENQCVRRDTDFSGNLHTTLPMLWRTASRGHGWLILADSLCTQKPAQGVWWTSSENVGSQWIFLWDYLSKSTSGVNCMKAWISFPMHAPLLLEWQLPHVRVTWLRTNHKWTLKLLMVLRLLLVDATLLEWCHAYTESFNGNSDQYL